VAALAAVRTAFGKARRVHAVNRHSAG
jgi:hypothetical protein